MSEISIRPLTTRAEIRATEEIQRQVWDCDDLEILPAHLGIALQHNGAVLLGAFDDDELVGFCMGVLGTVYTPERIDQVAAARLKMYSVITGVLPAYQDRGLGYQLKLAQREFALRIGVRLITWTYDFLESRNAYLNIAKLGAVCRHFLPNFYGELDGLNAGLSTDRFEVEWWVTGNRVVGRVEKGRRPLSLSALIGGGAVLVNEVTFNQAGLPVPPLNFVSRPSNLQLMEIPSDFQAIKEQDYDLAKRWREHGRTLFEELFPQWFSLSPILSFTKSHPNQIGAFIY